MWIEALQEVRNPSQERFEIRDAGGQVLMVLPFVEVIETGRGTQRPPPSFETLLETTRRAHGLQAEVSA